MSNIGASDVTYAILKQRKNASSQNSNLVRLSFGNGVLTYPAGGIPISIGKLGCPTYVESMVVVDQGTSGYKFQYDQSAQKLVMMQAPAQTHGHDFTVTKGAILGSSELGLSADATSATVNNNTIASTLVLAKATGPVASETLAASALSQASAVAIAAQVIEVEVIGW